MKIIYLTDIHDGLKGMKEVFQQTSPNLYMLSGDIIYKAFFSDDKIIEFCTYQEELEILAKNAGEDITPYDYATRVIRFSNKYSDAVQQSCVRYRELFNQAAKTMKEKYQKFCATAEISAGILHDKISEIKVVSRRPILSVTTPLINARKI